MQPINERNNMTTTYEQHTKWDLIPADVFNEFRGCDVQTIAAAFVDEAFADNPNDVRVNALYEIGQSRFSITNSRDARSHLFMIFISREVKARRTK
jgi:hypothetical protein